MSTQPTPNSRPNPAATQSHSAPQCATGRNIKFLSSERAARKVLESQHLTPQQTTAIDLLLRGFTDIQVAAEVGADRGTIYRWRRSRFFAEVLGKLRMQAWQQSAQRMQSLIQPALDLLSQHIKGDDPQLALRAAGMVLRTASSIHTKTSRRASRAPAPKPAADKKSWDDLDAYINAPMPVPGLAATLMRQQTPPKENL